MTNIEISDIFHALLFYAASAVTGLVAVGFADLAAGFSLAFAIPFALLALTILVAAIGMFALGAINVVVGVRKLRSALKGSR